MNHALAIGAMILAVVLFTALAYFVELYWWYIAPPALLALWLYNRRKHR